ncbi:MAG TPA: hypothetical protein VEX37_00840 [Thermomicrobiales bacterium]|nr:hypothetical protein [Thermomicrobiales bacterium]
MQHWHRRLVWAIVLATLVGALPALSVLALAPQTPAFQRTWQRTDQPVASQTSVRTWMWGPGFSATMLEPYDDAPGGWRAVQYFDKSRMEDNSYRASTPPWDVSNGLLVNELVSGNLQLGDELFEPREPAAVGIAGDPDDTSGVTYAFMGSLLDEPAAPEGTTIRRLLTPAATDGPYTSSDAMATYGITNAHFVEQTQHTVAAPFWEFMNASGQVYENGAYVSSQIFENPYYATGLPITDAYWANVKLAGSQRDVLVQCFERRCLTYTPTNPVEWRVEMGNVGQHYYIWRYGTSIPDEPPAIEISEYDPTDPAPLLLWPFEMEDEAFIVLQNDSPYPLRISFDGPTSQTLTIDANPNGVVHPSSDEFIDCDPDAPVDDIRLPPGTYRVKLDYTGAATNPGRGHWTVVPNAAYATCFHVFSDDIP